MSSNKGNIKRIRPQKYQNRTSFKNDLHDKSAKCKQLNSLNVHGVCPRCKDIIDWKIKYKKYKPLKSPGVCVKCHQKNITSAYRVICNKCSVTDTETLCTKCLQPFQNLSKPDPTPAENEEVQQAIKALPERKRRTLIRFMSKQSGEKKKQTKRTKVKNGNNDDEEESEDEKIEINPQAILDKINKLKLDCRKNGSDDFGSEDDDDDEEDDFPDSSASEGDGLSDCDSLVSNENER